MKTLLIIISIGTTFPVLAINLNVQNRTGNQIIVKADGIQNSKNPYVTISNRQNALLNAFATTIDKPFSLDYKDLNDNWQHVKGINGTEKNKNLYILNKNTAATVTLVSCGVDNVDICVDSLTPSNLGLFN